MKKKTKKTRGMVFMLMLVAVMTAIAAFSCEMPLPAYPSGNEGTTEGLGGGKKPPVLADYTSPDEYIPPLDAPVADDFIRGVDISNCYIIEQAGGVYYDADGNPGDIIMILKEAGVNYVRLRLWHNHQLAQNPGPYAGDGDNDLVKTKAIARRAKAAGMKFLLNFHYSDNWADPGRQQIPAAWTGYTVDQLVQAVYDYTFDTIMELKAAGAEPDMVQIGNEITPGILSPTIGSDAAKVARVLNAGAQAVRLAAPDAKIMLHLDSGGDKSKYETWFDRFATHGGTGAGTAEVDFDVIGLSWYPYYSGHKSIDELDDNIRNIISRYGKEAVVAEHSWAWTKEYDGDDLSNLFHTSQENQTKIQLTDTKGYVTASGIEFEGSGLPASPENQAKVLRAVMDATASAGGGGVFWWAADWIPAPGLKSNWDNQTLFDFNGKALPALAVLGGLTYSPAPPLAPGNLHTTATTIDTVALAWNTSATADTYAVYRADSASGPWTTPINDTITGTTYTDNDASLEPGTPYYYQVKAHNGHGWGNPSTTLTASTLALTAPASFQVSTYDTYSITLGWTAVSGATAYKIYHAQSPDTPADNAYSALSGADNLASGTTTYTHDSLSSSETHWYKISAVYGAHGEGPLSVAVSATTGAPPPPPAYATVAMNSGTLDADFSNSGKAASSTTSLSPSTTPNYDIAGLYVANNATNLYVAVDFGSNQPSGYKNDRLVVLIDNTASSAGGVTDIKVATTQTLTDSPSIEAYAQRIMKESSVTGTTGIACNVTAWTGGTSAESWLYTPGTPSGATVVKFSIPLANIGNVASGNVLRVFAAFSEGWDSGEIVVGDIIPSTGGTVENSNKTITLDMAQALSYTVK
ncbi:MAG: glycosyl hydrolase 53 family protein [Spirochaetaceae bacterium]|jgi:arabinogalactan endo-1,4-beta-galactosidase|nr:glycosyl hydrolase 53 family protein [Spirochaetaceae bacterium]